MSFSYLRFQDVPMRSKILLVSFLAVIVSVTILPSTAADPDYSTFNPLLAKANDAQRRRFENATSARDRRDENRQRRQPNISDGNNRRSLTDLVKSDQETRGRNSLNEMAREFLLKNPEVKYLGKPEWGGSDVRDKETGRPLPGYVDPALVKGAGPLGTVFPPTPAQAMGWNTESKVVEGMYYQMLSGLDGFNGWQNSDLKEFSQKIQSGNLVAKTVQYPLNAADEARAEMTAQLTALGNAAGDVAKEQAASAIEYCAKFMENFTAQPGSKWNQIRESLFVPIGLLLLLPGAVLSQIRATVGVGMPISLTQSNPFDGILRSVIAIFLIPATYLVVNYAIDFSNSITFTLASEYRRIFNADVYQDAVCSEIRAFPVRGPKENQNAGIAQTWPQTETPSIPRLEKNLYQNKVDDPCSNTYSAPENRTDEGMPLASVFGRLLAFGGNALLTSAWNVLCAFQMAYMLYLFWVGPVVAGLWVWPIKQFRDALPNWVEGVITLAFWSLFWNTAILIMACFKGMTDTGTVYETALNFLATASVKYAFDFVGLIKAAGQEASKATGVAGSSGHPEGASGGASSSPAATAPGRSASQSPTVSTAGPMIPNVPHLRAPANAARSSAQVPSRSELDDEVADLETEPENDANSSSETERLSFEPNNDLGNTKFKFQIPNMNMPIAVLDEDEIEPPPGESSSGASSIDTTWVNALVDLGSYETNQTNQTNPEAGRLLSALGRAANTDPRLAQSNNRVVW